VLALAELTEAEMDAEDVTLRVCESETGKEAVTDTLRVPAVAELCVGVDVPVQLSVTVKDEVGVMDSPADLLLVMVGVGVGGEGL